VEGNGCLRVWGQLYQVRSEGVLVGIRILAVLGHNYKYNRLVYCLPRDNTLYARLMLQQRTVASVVLLFVQCESPSKSALHTDTERHPE
jgi:hypothetical protein